MMSSFSLRVYELALAIPSGRVTTYGTLARCAGGTPMTARSISNILSQAPNQRAVPWHRIVYAGGKVWLPDEAAATRRRLYRQEGIIVTSKGYIQNFDDIFYDFADET